MNDGMANTVRSQAAERIAALTSEACIELWRDYGVAITPGAEGWGVSDEPVLFGVIGFVGDTVRATCLLGAHQRLIEASCRAGNRSRDWIAELSNQLMGRLKMRLLGCGVSVKLTTPLTLSGVRLMPLPRLGHEPMPFASELGSVIVWLELETDPNFVLGAEERLSVAPGDLVF
jgi:hypothetical protein